MNKKSITSYWNDLIDTKADKETVMDFFLVFSRFEYALKRAGYLKSNKTWVGIDWERFSHELKNFTSDKTPELREAIDFLKSEPAREQIVEKDNLIFKKEEPLNYEPNIQWILKQVRIVRNNLFHGGKFHLLNGSIKDPARNPQLIENCLIILEACLELHSEVQRYFEESNID